MHKMADRLTKAIKKVFEIPETYEMSAYEESKLLRIIEEAKSVMNARVYRALDCSAFCFEDKCFFCSGGKPGNKI